MHDTQILLFRLPAAAPGDVTIKRAISFGMFTSLLRYQLKGLATQSCSIEAVLPFFLAIDYSWLIPRYHCNR
jgi:hypothetical protein